MDYFAGASQPGRHAHLFQPPQSAVLETHTPSAASASDYFSSTTNSRKRARPDSSHDSRPSWNQTPSWVQCPTPGDASYSSATAGTYDRNDRLVNERYTLAGGLDTPGLQAEVMGMDWRADGDMPRRRGQVTRSVSGYSARAELRGPLARERNGAARMPSSPNGPVGGSWTGLAFNLVGSIFSFGTNVVKGFYAGGGHGYDLKRSPLHMNFRNLASPPEPCSTPLPGSWREDEFLGDFEQDNPSSATRPPNKRRQTDKDSWVVVGTPDLETSPKRREPLARPTASRASSRRSLAPLPRRQSSSQSTFSTGSPLALPPPPIEHRRASFAPIRSNSRPNSRPSSSGAATTGVNAAYLSPETEKYLKRRDKHDRKADAAMTDMSRKLADLIRAGQEALGTKISVEGDVEGEQTDEGFVDEEW
ncbi:hypothetical protein LTR86_010627 [Recurvomyces mirabilis]|nr:hypothetical protein LTR86_010627 [Recurvomyces mirabilis]